MSAKARPTDAPRRAARGRASAPAAALAAAAWLAAPSVAGADIHRCVDREGTLHFTNVPPPGARCTLFSREAARPRSEPRAAGRAAGGAADASRFDTHFREAAALYHLPESLLRAVARVESAFDPRVVSVKGAMGLMQLMPQTAAAMGVMDPFDPRQNILGGARFLRILANRFGGDLVLTIAAYNAGDGAVLRYNGVPPYAETRRYVRRVLEHYYAYRAAEDRGAS